MRKMRFRESQAISIGIPPFCVGLLTVFVTNPRPGYGWVRWTMIAVGASLVIGGIISAINTNRRIDELNHTKGESDGKDD